MNSPISSRPSSQFLNIGGNWENFNFKWSDTSISTSATANISPSRIFSINSFTVIGFFERKCVFKKTPTSYWLLRAHSHHWPCLIVTTWRPKLCRYCFRFTVLSWCTSPSFEFFFRMMFMVLASTEMEESNIRFKNSLTMLAIPVHWKGPKCFCLRAVNCDFIWQFVFCSCNYVKTMSCRWSFFDPFEYSHIK